jgi:hypothetical protein
MPDIVSPAPPHAAAAPVPAACSGAALAMLWHLSMHAWGRPRKMHAVLGTAVAKSARYTHHHGCRPRSRSTLAPALLPPSPRAPEAPHRSLVHTACCTSHRTSAGPSLSSVLPTALQTHEYQHDRERFNMKARRAAQQHAAGQAAGGHAQRGSSAAGAATSSAGTSSAAGAGGAASALELQAAGAAEGMAVAGAAAPEQKAAGQTSSSAASCAGATASQAQEAGSKSASREGSWQGVQAGHAAGEDARAVGSTAAASHGTATTAVGSTAAATHGAAAAAGNGKAGASARPGGMRSRLCLPRTLPAAVPAAQQQQQQQDEAAAKKQRCV